MDELRPHQKDVIDKVHNGCILYAEMGTGKSRVAMEYYMKKELPKDLYIITTGKKRDELDWQGEAAWFGIGKTKDATIGGVLTVDSFNNIQKYTEIEDAFFVFDEQRLVGSGAWAAAFIKIAKRNNWIMLSATPGDVWMDYVPVFVANGFYKNRTEFIREHVIYKPYRGYPVIDRYDSVYKLVRLRNQILVEMPYERHTVRNSTDIIVDYDKELFERVLKKRWHVYENRPLKNVAELFYVMRKVVNSDESRIASVRSLMQTHPKLIVFYNFDYELEILRTLNGLVIPVTQENPQNIGNSSTHKTMVASEENQWNSQQTYEQIPTHVDTTLSKPTSPISSDSSSFVSVVEPISNMSIVKPTSPISKNESKKTTYTTPTAVSGSTLQKNEEMNEWNKMEKTTLNGSKILYEQNSNVNMMNDSLEKLPDQMSLEKETSNCLPMSKENGKFDQSKDGSQRNLEESSQHQIMKTHSHQEKNSNHSSEFVQTINGNGLKSSVLETPLVDQKKSTSITTSTLPEMKTVTGGSSDCRVVLAEWNEQKTEPKNQQQMSSSNSLNNQLSVNHSSYGSEQQSKTGSSSFELAEWNGHRHEKIPAGENWVYLVQYVAGSESWNCIETDAICFYSLTYSYKMWHQSHGRIDRLNTPFTDLYYYVLKSDSVIDKAIAKSLASKKSFNEKRFVGKLK